ncbi:hypothetical protein [Bradyrhizobium sp. SSUT18]|uniref:hypothetical protein n=1 Tax=Bradyrhizobium sp. SSUT18 TaxID=3040602 RepID=UPI0032633522
MSRESGIACSAGERGAELTQRLLAFSRKQLLRPVEAECSKLVDSMHKLLRRTLREDIVITTHFDPGPARLRRSGAARIGDPQPRAQRAGCNGVRRSLDQPDSELVA